VEGAWRAGPESSRANGREFHAQPARLGSALPHRRFSGWRPTSSSSTSAGSTQSRSEASAWSSARLRRACGHSRALTMSRRATGTRPAKIRALWPCRGRGDPRTARAALAGFRVHGPAAFVALDSLPVTRSGKIDGARLARSAKLRSALPSSYAPEPVGSKPGRHLARVLGIDEASVDQSFSSSRALCSWPRRWFRASRPSLDAR